MSFKMNEFLLENLRNGYINKSFTKEQVNIFAVGYLMKGMFSQEEFNELLAWVETYVFEEDLPPVDPEEESYVK